MKKIKLIHENGTESFTAISDSVTDTEIKIQYLGSDYFVDNYGDKLNISPVVEVIIC